MGMAAVGLISHLAVDSFWHFMRAGAGGSEGWPGLAEFTHQNGSMRPL